MICGAKYHGGCTGANLGVRGGVRIGPAWSFLGKKKEKSRRCRLRNRTAVLTHCRDWLNFVAHRSIHLFIHPSSKSRRCACDCIPAPAPRRLPGWGGYLHNLAGCSHNRGYVKKSVHILYPCRPNVRHVDLVQYVVLLGCKKRAII